MNKKAREFLESKGILDFIAKYNLHISDIMSLYVKDIEDALNYQVEINRDSYISELKSNRENIKTLRKIAELIGCC